jgi:hypothetical protein
MTLLEDRLAAAGDQLDLLIDRELDDGLGRAGARHDRATHLRTLTVAAVTLALLASGLALITRGPEQIEAPAADVVPTSAPEPAPATTFEPGAPGCGIDQSQLVVVASTTDSQGRSVDYRVGDLPDAYSEQLHFSGGGWSGGCDGDVPLSVVHPTGAWTNVAAMTSIEETEVYVHGKLPPGSGPHLVTLTSGDVVPITPTADGWFLATQVIRRVDDVQAVSTEPDRAVVTPTTETSVPATTQLPDAEPTTTLPIADRPPIAIGESVMLGAAPQLAAGGFVVNADESRWGDTAAEVVRQYRSTGQIGTTVVIQVGTNGPVSQEIYDEIMRHLPPEEVEQVIFLTVSAPRGWIEPNNELIRSLPSRYPNVKVLDWAGLVASGQVPGLAADGVHLGTDAAKQWYANYVFDFSGRRDLVQPLPTDG